MSNKGSVICCIFLTKQSAPLNSQETKIAVPNFYGSVAYA